jgi:hypothetical protein
MDALKCVSGNAAPEQTRLIALSRQKTTELPGESFVPGLAGDGGASVRMEAKVLERI